MFLSWTPKTTKRLYVHLNKSCPWRRESRCRCCTYDINVMLFMSADWKAPVRDVKSWSLKNKLMPFQLLGAQTW